MPDPITFTPEEEARYARWGLGVQSDGEPAVTTPSTTQEVPAVQDPPADAGTDEDVLDEGDEGHEGGEEGADSAGQPPKKKSGVQRLKEKLQAEREEKIRLEERLRILEEGRKPAEPAVPTPAPAASKDRPDPDKFLTQAEYLDALTDWKIEQREAAKEAAAKEEKAKAEAQVKQKTWDERLTAAKGRYPDFDQALKTPFPMSPAMREAMLESELGPDLGYYLVKHQEEAGRIAAMSPAAAALALGTIQAKLAPAEAPKPPTPPKTTQAPPPPTPVGGRPTPTVDTSKLSDEEWLQYNRKQRSGR